MSDTSQKETILHFIQVVSYRPVIEIMAINRVAMFKALKIDMPEVCAKK